MDYQNFDIEDFLTNAEFIRWATDPSPELDAFWEKWLEAHPEKQQAVWHARKILNSTRFQHTPTDAKQHDRVLHKILKGSFARDTPRTVNFGANNQKPFRFSISMANKVAAVLVFLLTFSAIIYFNTKPTEDAPQKLSQWIVKENPKGQKSTFMLPDSTLVVLNAESKLTYPAAFPGFRDVVLRGEAYFRVARDIKHPFRVKTKNVVTTALGTSFNIKAYDEDQDISVALNSGKVAINAGNEQSPKPVYLNPGEKLVYHKDKQTSDKMRFENAKELSWKDGILVFEKTGLHDFINTIERWYDVQVDVLGEPNAPWYVNGRFKNQSLDVVLRSIHYTEGVNYQITDKKVTLIFN